MKTENKIKPGHKKLDEPMLWWSMPVYRHAPSESICLVYNRTSRFICIYAADASVYVYVQL